MYLLFLPKSVKITVSICLNKLIAVCKGKFCLRLICGSKALELCSLFCLDSDKFDIVSLCHRVDNRADNNRYLVSVNSNLGNVLFNGGINGAGYKLSQFLTAAHNGNAAGISKSYDVFTVFADVEFHNYFPPFYGTLSQTM